MAGTKTQNIKMPRDSRSVHERWRKYIKLNDKGLNPNMIALIYGVSHNSVRYGIKRGKELIEIYGKLW